MNKKKYFNITLIFICIISITLIGTYALKLWSSTNNTELTFRIGEYSTNGITCKTSEDITVSNIGPIFDYNIDGEIIPFTVVAGSSNEEKLYINFNIENITSNLKEESFKYILLSSIDKTNYNEVVSGNFLNVNSNDTIELISNYVINKTTYYKLIIYIDGNMENPISMQNGSITGNLEVCSSEKFDVTLNVTNGTSDNNILKVPSGDNAIFTITASDGYTLDIESQTCEGILNSSTGIYTINNITENKECNLTLKQGNLDTSGANSPDLVDGLIPVMYNGSKWVKADSSNSNETYKWYDYDNKLWANAVLVTSTNRNTYMAAIPGREIAESDILAYYVWIPRYKYKVWNINKVIGTDSYSARTKGIEIVFESEKESTGTISCTYNFSVTDNSKLSETCAGSNGNYYTHPAFTFGNDNIRGFWISKFEISSSNPSASYGGGSTTSLNVKSIPNVNSWRYNTLSNFNTVIQNMQTSSNIYGLNTSRTNTDSHVITNMEWGAVAYLTNSKYGRCTNGSCTEVTINNCSSYITGIASGYVSGDAASSTCTATENKYNGSKGVLASTTANVNGVYDMSGGSWELVMGSMSKNSRNYNFNYEHSGFSSSWYSSNQKYLITYAYVPEYNGATETGGTEQSEFGYAHRQGGYNTCRLGDAMGEIVLSTSGDNGGWYNDESYTYYVSNAWTRRGGNCNDGSGAGVFYFSSMGLNIYVSSTRATLVSLK